MSVLDRTENYVRAFLERQTRAAVNMLNPLTDNNFWLWLNPDYIFGKLKGFVCSITQAKAFQAAYAPDWRE